MVESRSGLPVELWIKILDQIQDKAQLASCRLVCKSWDVIAEKATFKEVVLSDQSASKLCNYLKQKPRAAQYIERVFIMIYGLEMNLFQETMALAMQNNLKALGGELSSSEMQKALLAAIQTLPSKCVKLEQLPFSTSFTRSYAALLYHCKETMQSISIKLSGDDNIDALHTTANKLEEFPKLTQLSIDNYSNIIDSNQGLESILKGCPHLKNLRLGLSAQSVGPDVVDDPDIDDRFFENVQTVESMKSISIQFSLNRCSMPENACISGSDLFQYLSFKYPKVDSLFISGYHPVLQYRYPVFKHLDTFHLKRWVFKSFDGIEQLINLWKRQCNSCYSAANGIASSAFTIDVEKKRHSDHTTFGIIKTLNDTPMDSFVQFLSAFGDSVVKWLQVDLTHYDGHNDSSDTFLSEILLKAPYVECLKLKAQKMVLIKSVPLIQLKRVELVNVVSTTADITALGSSAPQLKHLSLAACCICDKNQPWVPQYSYHLEIPNNQLGTVMISEELTMKSPRNGLIHLLINESTHYLLAGSASQPLIQMSQRDYNLRSRGHAMIFVRCQKLKHLKVNFDKFQFEIEFDAQGTIKCVAPGLQDFLVESTNKYSSDIQIEEIEDISNLRF
ncbi:hypothetical protein MBANPS3_002151 [Mucor bainieri]